MKSLSILLLVIPFFSIFCDIFLKYFERISKIILLFLQILFFSTTVYIFYYILHYSNLDLFLFQLNWIPLWGLNFVISINGSNIFSLLAVSIIFLILFIQNFNFSYKARLNYLLIQGSIIGAILSYDLILKLFFWELTWLPVMLILSTYNTKESLKYSKMWFLSQFFIISSLVILSVNENFSFNIFELYKLHLIKSPSNTASFILLTIGLSIRLSIFPFDKWAYSIFKNTDYVSTVLFTVLIPLLTFHFFCEFYRIIFAGYLLDYSFVLTILFFVLAIPPLAKLFYTKNFENIVSYTIIMLNPFIFIWVINSNISSIQAVFEVIYTKIFLSISLVYFSKLLIINSKNLDLKSIFYSNFYVTGLFFISIFLSFGVPGLTLIKPFIYLSNYLAQINIAISILILSIMVLSFIYILNSTVHMLFAGIQKPIMFRVSKLLLISTTIFLIVAVAISIYPVLIHNMVFDYYKEVIILK